MATRRERVILDLEDNFTAPMLRAAGAAQLLNQQLNALSGHAVTSTRSTQRMARDMDSVATSAKRADSSINQLTGRLRLFADLAAILGPSLVPIGAVAVPAVTGLAQQLGFAALGTASLVTAFQGVGDALTAVNDAALDPTAENLEKARVAMAGIGPEAQGFVTRFQELRPTLDGIRDAAAAGWFPGLTESLDSFQQIAPQVATMFERIGRTGGALVAEGAAAFAGPEWDDFRSFLTSEAAPRLDELGRTVGNLAAGMAELWMAFSPLNRDFSSWLLDASRGFREWSEGLSQTQGFAEFVDYIRTNGPRVADALSAVGDAVLQIIEAVAPLGGPSLQIIESFATAIAAIADSDLGTPIFAAVAAYSALNRVLQMTAALQARINGGAAAGGGIAGMLGIGASARTGIRGTLTDLRAMSREYGRLGRAQSTVLAGMSQTSGAAQRTADRLKGVGKAGAGVAALAVATTGLGDSMGVTNTATLSLMGTMAGPWGAAIGAGVGLAIDFANANKDIEAAITAANQAASSGDMDAMNQAFISLNDQLREQDDLVSRDGGFWDFIDDTTSMKGVRAQAELMAESLFGIESSGTKAEAAMRDLRRIQENYAANAGADLADQKIAAQLEAQASAARDAAAGFLEYGDAAAGAKFNLDNYLTGLEKQVTAQARFDANISNLRSRGLDETVIQELIRQGPKAAQAVDALANGTDAAIERMNRSFRRGQAGVRNFGEDTERELRGAKQSFDSLPKDVRTDIRANGIPQTEAEVDGLVKKYKLTEKQRQALVTLKDLASDHIQGVIRLLLDYDRQSPTANVNVNTGTASAQIASIRAQLASIERTIPVRVVVTRTNSGSRSTDGGIPINADGGFYSNGVRQFADGGYGENGRYYSRIPQIISGGANIMWGEKETGWEAYISGKPGQEARNRSVLIEAAKRLNMFADGGIPNHWRMPAAQVSSQPASKRAAGPLRIVGTLDTPFGPAQVAGVARAVARDEIEQHDVWTERRRRRA